MFDVKRGLEGSECLTFSVGPSRSQNVCFMLSVGPRGVRMSDVKSGPLRFQDV